MSAGPGRWPELDLRTWAPTKRALHLYSQMLGKVRLALSPDQPEWMFSALVLTARGFTTGPLPWGAASVQVALDVFSAEIEVATSDGRRTLIPLVPARTVAEVYAAVCAALTGLGVRIRLTTVPQELADLTPLDEDRRPPAYDAAAVQDWFAAVTAIAGTFDRWRAHFFGRTGIQLWWGALDLSLLLFNGRKVAPPLDRGYLLRYDLDAEMLNAGFYPGDEQSPEPFVYAYLYPQPAACATLPIAPPQASWSATLGEWVLPYAALRAAPDPPALLLEFLDSVYATACGSAGWDRDALSYARPKRSLQA